MTDARISLCFQGSHTIFFSTSSLFGPFPFSHFHIFLIFLTFPLSTKTNIPPSIGSGVWRMDRFMHACMHACMQQHHRYHHYPLYFVSTALCYAFVHLPASILLEVAIFTIFTVIHLQTEKYYHSLFIQYCLLVQTVLYRDKRVEERKKRGVLSELDSNPPYPTQH